MSEPIHQPVDTSKAAPAKSILKKKNSHLCSSHSTDEAEDLTEREKRAKWDEMNIIATYHPADKDYGHMKIDDPPTPYHEYSQEQAHADEKMDATDDGTRERKTSFSEKTAEPLDADTIANKLKESKHKRVRSLSEGSADSDEDESQLSDELKVKKAEFREKRKHHYNEFQAVKLARELIDQEDDDEEGDNGNAANARSLPQPME